MYAQLPLCQLPLRASTHSRLTVRLQCMHHMKSKTRINLLPCWAPQPRSLCAILRERPCHKPRGIIAVYIPVLISSTALLLYKHLEAHIQLSAQLSVCVPDTNVITSSSLKVVLGQSLIPRSVSTSWISLIRHQCSFPSQCVHKPRSHQLPLVHQNKNTQNQNLKASMAPTTTMDVFSVCY